MENASARYEGISVCWIEKCTFISGIVAMARGHVARRSPENGLDVARRERRIGLEEEGADAGELGCCRGCSAENAPAVVRTRFVEIRPVAVEFATRRDWKRQISRVGEHPDQAANVGDAPAGINPAR